MLVSMEATELQQRAKLLASTVLLEDLLLLWNSQAAPSAQEENTQRQLAKTLALSVLVESFSATEATLQEH